MNGNTLCYSDLCVNSVSKSCQGRCKKVFLDFPTQHSRFNTFLNISE